VALAAAAVVGERGETDQEEAAATVTGTGEEVAQALDPGTTVAHAMTVARVTTVALHATNLPEAASVTGMVPGTALGTAQGPDLEAGMTGLGASVATALAREEIGTWITVLACMNGLWQESWSAAERCVFI
jgi:hypothetical protein